MSKRTLLLRRRRAPVTISRKRMLGLVHRTTCKGARARKRLSSNWLVRPPSRAIMNKFGRRHLNLIDPSIKPSNNLDRLLQRPFWSALEFASFRPADQLSERSWTSKQFSQREKTVACQSQEKSPVLGFVGRSSRLWRQLTRHAEFFI